MAHQFEQTDPPSEKLFVANIPPYITKADLNEIFSKFGMVENCHVPEGKNFGFVRFDTLESANAAVRELNGKDLTGSGSKRLVVKYQKDKPRPQMPGQQHHQHSPRQPLINRSPAQFTGQQQGPQMVSYEPDAPRRAPPSQHHNFPPQPQHNTPPPVNPEAVFNEGLVAARIAAAKLAAQAAAASGLQNPASYNPPPDTTHLATPPAAPKVRKSRFDDDGDASARNRNERAAPTQKEIDREQVKMRNIINNPHLSEEQKKKMLYEIERKQNSRVQSTQQMDEDNTLFIANLHPETRQHELEQRFKVFGDVLMCKVVMDERTNQSKNYGFISFSTGDEAQLAIRHMSGAPNKEDPEAATRNLVVKLKQNRPVHSALTGTSGLSPMSSANKPYNPHAASYGNNNPYSSASNLPSDIEVYGSGMVKSAVSTPVVAPPPALKPVPEEVCQQHVFIPHKTYERLAGQNTLEKLRGATGTKYNIVDQGAEQLLVVSGNKDKVACLVEVLTSTIEAFPGLPRIRLGKKINTSVIEHEAPADPKQAYFQQATKKRKRRWRDDDEEAAVAEEREKEAQKEVTLADQLAQFYSNEPSSAGRQDASARYEYADNSQQQQQPSGWSSRGGGFSDYGKQSRQEQQQPPSRSHHHQQHQQFWNTQQGPDSYGL